MKVGGCSWSQRPIQRINQRMDRRLLNRHPQGLHHATSLDPSLNLGLGRTTRTAPTPRPPAASTWLRPRAQRNAPLVIRRHRTSRSPRRSVWGRQPHRHTAHTECPSFTTHTPIHRPHRPPPHHPATAARMQVHSDDVAAPSSALRPFLAQEVTIFKKTLILRLFEMFIQTINFSKSA